MTNDLDSMRKAKKRAAWKNLNSSAGNVSKFSFIHFPSVDISSRLSDLGVNLGSNSKSVLESISLLKNNEVARVRPELARTDVFTEPVLLEDEDDFDLENGTLGRICGDLLDEFENLDSDHLSCEFKSVFKKNKASSLTRSKNKPNVRIVKRLKTISP